MVNNLEFLVEEPSMERLLRHVLPRIAPTASFEIRTFNGKPDLLRKLPQRLRGYAPWVAAANTGIVVVLDRDAEDCVALKTRLDPMARAAGLRCTSVAGAAQGVVLNRLAIEELEAWFFGDVPALVAAYPGVPATLAEKARFRDPDAVGGGTWKALERVLQSAGHHHGGLRKRAVADDIGPHLDVEANTSSSFQKFRDGVRFLVDGASLAEA